MVERQILIFSLFSIFFLLIISSLVVAGSTSISSTSTPITLKTQDEVYNNIGPGSLVFDFEGRSYSLQLRKIGKDYAEFNVLANLRSASDSKYIDYFELSEGDSKEVDLNNDKTYDLYISLENLDDSGRGSASFTLKRLSSEKGSINIKDGSEERSFVDQGEPLILNQGKGKGILETKDRTTLIERLIQWFKDR